MDPTSRRRCQACLADSLDTVLALGKPMEMECVPSLCPLRETKLRPFSISSLNWPPKPMDELSCCLKWKQHTQLQGGELMGQKQLPHPPPQLSLYLSTAGAEISPSRKMFHPQEMPGRQPRVGAVPGELSAGLFPRGADHQLLADGWKRELNPPRVLAAPQARASMGVLPPGGKGEPQKPFFFLLEGLKQPPGSPLEPANITQCDTALLRLSVSELPDPSVSKPNPVCNLGMIPVLI